MARPIIDDRKALIRIAHHRLDRPKASFCELFRLAANDVRIEQHSLDAARRRLHRKFRRNETSLLQEAKHQRSATRQEDIDLAIKHLMKTVNSVTVPATEVAGRLLPIIRMATGPDVQTVTKEVSEIISKFAKGFR